jgi:hypothetical protein
VLNDNSQHNFEVQLIVGGVDYGRWAGFDGGEKTSEDSSYDDWDGEQVLAGKLSRDDITLKKGYRREVHAIFRELDGRVGDHSRGECAVVVSPTGDDGVSWGNPTTYKGLLRGCTPPTYDKSSSDGSELVVTIKPDPVLS